MLTLCLVQHVLTKIVMLHCVLVKFMLCSNKWPLNCVAKCNEVVTKGGPQLQLFFCKLVEKELTYLH